MDPTEMEIAKKLLCSCSYDFGIPKHVLKAARSEMSRDEN